MDAMEALMKRHSTRSFQKKPILKEILEKIVDAGRYAATAINQQPWAFVVVTSEETLKNISDLTDYGKCIGQASACILVFARNSRYYLEDGCAATENILIAATALGVQSCWIAGDKKSYTRPIGELLGVPEEYLLVSMVALGYEAQAVERAHKRALSEMLHWEKWYSDSQK